MGVTDMAPRTVDYINKLISIVTRRTKLADQIFRQGDWAFIQLGNYTEAAPLSILQGASAKITFQESDISFAAGEGLVVNYDHTNQLFMPTQVDDLFMVTIRFKAKSSAQNGSGEVVINSPGVIFNPIVGLSFGIPKAAGVEQFETLNTQLFIGQDLVDNGLEVVAKAITGDLSIYDVSFTISRLSSGWRADFV
ncbi:hypothetical protein S0112_073 [Shewanella phage S0112]|nr:hypothetical protein S0112_073 [Shewanella phage S0112]